LIEGGLPRDKIRRPEAQTVTPQALPADLIYEV
jgi:hypothetical protein